MSSDPNETTAPDVEAAVYGLSEEAAVVRLVEWIGYPENISEGSDSFFEGH